MDFTHESYLKQRRVGALHEQNIDQVGSNSLHNKNVKVRIRDSLEYNLAILLLFGICKKSPLTIREIMRSIRESHDTLDEYCSRLKGYARLFGLIKVDKNWNVSLTPKGEAIQSLIEEIFKCFGRDICHSTLLYDSEEFRVTLREISNILEQYISAYIHIDIISLQKDLSIKLTVEYPEITSFQNDTSIM